MRFVFLDNSDYGLTSVSDTKVRGGVASCLFRVTDHLSRKGHDVTVLSRIGSTGATPAGTKWLREFWGTYDALVCNRGMGAGYPEIDAKRRFLWTHDLPHAGFVEEPKVLRAFTTVFMSDYAERFWRDYYRDIDESVQIPNGVDPIFYPREKDLDTIIYTSAPNRGLNRLPMILNGLREATGRKIRLIAYSNLAKLHPGEVGKGDTFDYESIRQQGVELHDPVPQDELAGRMGQAGLMIMPSDYPEICSNSIPQSLRSGTPVITTGNLGSAGQWIRNGINGFLTRWQPHDYMIYQMEIMRFAMLLLNDRGRHEEMISCAARTPILSWQQVGDLWEQALCS